MINPLMLQSNFMSLTSIIKLISVISVKEWNNLQGCFHLWLLKGVVVISENTYAVGISALANLFSVQWSRVSRDALFDILISVEHICRIPALTKGDLYAPVSAYAGKISFCQSATLFLHKRNRKLLPFD